MNNMSTAVYLSARDVVRGLGRVLATMFGLGWLMFSGMITFLWLMITLSYLQSSNMSYSEYLGRELVFDSVPPYYISTGWVIFVAVSVVTWLLVAVALFSGLVEGHHSELEQDTKASAH